MSIVDDRTLEYLRENGTSTPKKIGDDLREIGGGMDFDNAYISQRCVKMSKYGLLNKIARGVYSITEVGQQYLDEEIDASELTK